MRTRTSLKPGMALGLGSPMPDFLEAGHGARFGVANGHRQLRLQHIEVAHIGFHRGFVEGGLLRGIGGAEQKGTQQAEGDGSKHSAFYCNGWLGGMGGVTGEAHWGVPRGPRPANRGVQDSGGIFRMFAEFGGLIPGTALTRARLHSQSERSEERIMKRKIGTDRKSTRLNS